MRFTSLIVELIRARPRLVFWLAVSIQSGLWLLLPLLFYASPPRDLAMVLAIGREHQVGSEFGPPLAFWLADLAFRLAGNHVAGVYLLAQLSAVLTFWALHQLARAMVGAQHAVIAVLLTLTVTVFAAPGVEFGPLLLLRPLWALLLLHLWQIIGEGRRNAWFALSIDVGLLLLAAPSAAPLLLLPIGFALVHPRGRRALASVDPLYALLVIAVLVLPYGIWLLRGGVVPLPELPAPDQLAARALHWGELLIALLVPLAGIAALVALNLKQLGGSAEPPSLHRPPVDPLARQFVYVFALAPAVAGSVLSALFGFDQVVGGSGVALLLAGLAVVILSGDVIYLRRQRLLRVAWGVAVAAPAAVLITLIVVQPWTGGAERDTSLPARDIARFFSDSFERRTNKPLEAVAGDPHLAALIGLGPTRPHWLRDAAPETTPWLTLDEFAKVGGVVVWRASDTVGLPPAEIAKRFPDLVPEIPRAFEWMIAGRQPLLRIGWAIVRPKPAP